MKPPTVLLEQVVDPKTPDPMPRLYEQAKTTRPKSPSWPLTDRAGSFLLPPYFVHFQAPSYYPAVSVAGPAQTNIPRAPCSGPTKGGRVGWIVENAMVPTYPWRGPGALPFGTVWA